MAKKAQALRQLAERVILIWSSKESNIDIDIKSVEVEKLECSPFSVIRDYSWRVHFSTTGTVFELAGKSMTVLQTPQISNSPGELQSYVNIVILLTVVDLLCSTKL